MGLIRRFKDYKTRFIEENRKLIKPNDFTGSLFKKVSRVVSIYIGRFLYKHTSLSANQLTTIINVISLGIAYLFYLGEYKYVLAGGILLILNQFLDYTDGVIARLRGTQSHFGSWYDHLSDWMSQMFVFFGMAFGVYNQTGDWRVWAFTFSAGTAYLFSMLLFTNLHLKFPKYAKVIVEKEKSKRRWIKNFFYDGPLVFTTIFFASLFNLIYPALIFFGIYGWMYCIAAFYMISRKVLSYYGPEELLK